MARRCTWVILLIALFMVAACRPAAEEFTGTPTASDQDPGICPPEGPCEDQTAEAEHAGATAAAPTSAPAGDATAPAGAQPTAVPTAEPTAPGAEPTPAESVADPLAPRETDWVIGPEDATVILLEYGDYL